MVPLYTKVTIGLSCQQGGTSALELHYFHSIGKKDGA